jgi:hypothetical protein
VPRSTRSEADAAADRGAGLVSALVGITVFLTLLLFSAQLLVGLYARSVVTAAAFDAARIAAGAASDSDGDGLPDGDALSAAETHARRLLGRFGREQARFDWSVDGDRVALRVRAAAPRLLGAGLGNGILGDIDRTVRVRLERFRDS